MTSPMQNYPQFSPGSRDRRIGCLAFGKCFAACLFFEESQQSDVTTNRAEPEAGSG